MVSDRTIAAAQRYMTDDSPAWTGIRDYLKAAIQDKRESLDSTQLDSIQTAVIRGEIKAMKELLALPETVTQVAQSDPGYGTTEPDESW